MSSSFVDKSSHSYNLRSSARKRASAQNCYIQTLLKNRSPNLCPQVCLERLKLLENPECNSSRFYIHKNHEIMVYQTYKPSSIKRVFKIVCLMLLVISSLMYFRDELQWCLSLQKYSKYKIVDNNKGVIQLHKKDLKKDDNTKRGVNEITNINFTKLDRSFKKSHVNFDFQKLIRSSYEGVTKKDENMKKKPESFIEEQCRRDRMLEVTDSFNEIINDLNEANFFDSPDLTDYALESKGAKIVSTFDTESYGVVGIKFWNYDFGIVGNSFVQKYLNSKGPTSILVPWRKPGDCWAFKGSHGRVQIQLSEKIMITAFTIDHIPSDLFGKNNIQSAPKKFSIVGIEEAESGISNRMTLGTYEYKITGPSIQMFSIVPKVEIFYRTIEVNIISNHGKEYTCIYKVRVHGHK